jgi:hypothetical protein
VSRHLSPSLTSSSTPQRRTAAPLRGRGLAAAACLLLAVPLAAGCSAGFNNASQQINPNSGAGSVGDIKINNVWVVIDPTTGNAEIVAAVANTGQSTDTLERVTATNVPASVSGQDASEATTGISVSGNSVTIPAGQAVSFGQSANPELELADANFAPGLLSQITFTFEQAGSVTVTAQIQPNTTGLFKEYNPDAGITPTAVPTTPPPTPTSTVTGTPTAGGTATATGTPIATPTQS